MIRNKRYVNNLESFPFIRQTRGKETSVTHVAVTHRNNNNKNNRINSNDKKHQRNNKDFAVIDNDNGEAGKEQGSRVADELDTKWTEDGNFDDCLCLGKM